MLLSAEVYRSLSSESLLILSPISPAEALLTEGKLSQPLICFGLLPGSRGCSLTNILNFARLKICQFSFSSFLEIILAISVFFFF